MNFCYRVIWSLIFILASLLINKSTVLASTKNTIILIESNGNNSYNMLVQNAENLAQNRINQEFDNNPEITEISLTILGERRSQIVPVLRSTVSRREWENNPKIDNFTRYFADAKFLLRFEDNSNISDSQPQVPNSFPKIPAPPAPSSDSLPIAPQPQRKSPRRKPISTSPRFPTNEDDPTIIDD